MKRIPSHPPSVRRASLRVLAVLALLLAPSAGALVAASGEMALGGGGTGGDTVGSLPLLSSNNPGGDDLLFALAPPMITLTGRPADVLAVVSDAYPVSVDAGYRRVALAAPDTFRYEFYGRLVIVLDRAAFHDADVPARVLIGSTFDDGIALVRVNGVLRAIQALHTGLLELHLKQLDEAGVLTQGLNWHAISVENVRRVLAFKAIGNQIKIEQRE